MDAFFQENRDSYINQVAAFKPSYDHSKDDGGESGGDTLLAARVRPLLPREIEENEVLGITVRPESGFADVHELRRKVNGQSALSVKDPLSVLK
jgi:kinesin family member 2/24